MAVGIGTILLVSALAGLIGDYMMHQENKQYNSSEAEKTREFNAEEAEKARLFNSAEAQKDRDFQNYMSSTAHQREVADLKAAGLNPILSANSGAAVGSGAQAVSSFGGSSSQAVSSPFKMSNSINSALGMGLASNQHAQEMELKLKSIPPRRSGYSQNIYRNGKLVREIDTNYRY